MATEVVSGRADRKSKASRRDSGRRDMGLFRQDLEVQTLRTARGSGKRGKEGGGHKGVRGFRRRSEIVTLVVAVSVVFGIWPPAQFTR
jgi:hypothetical protein